MVDTSKIEATYNEFLFINLAGAVANNGTFNFNVPFTPDFLNVKSISYSPGAGDVANGIYPVSFNLLNPAVMGYFVVQTDAAKISFPNNYDLLFKINREVKGDWTIQINDGLLNFTGKIGIMIQWIKLKSEKPQAIL